MPDDNVKPFNRTAMKVEFSIFVVPGVTEVQVREYIDTVVHHAAHTVMNTIGDYVFQQPTVREIK